MSGDVFDGDRILDSEAMALAFHPGLVDQDSSVGGQAYGLVDWVRNETSWQARRARTSKSKADVIIQHDHFSYCARVL
jgi:hypothetical protein